MEKFVEEVPAISARKRKRDPSTWKRNKEKVLRYCPAGNPKQPTCGHSSKAYRCSSLTMAEINLFHQAFYEKPVKQIQDAFILKNVEPLSIKRSRNDGMREPKTVSVNYFIRVEGKVVPVCREAFLGVLQITKHRVNAVVQNFKRTGTMPREKRGGDRKSRYFEEKRSAVVAFIKTFKCLESHYCRSKSSVRHYVGGDLSIKKMWRMYNTGREQSTQVTHSFFRMIFTTRFNIGFGSPRTDVCSKCLELKEKVKTARTDALKNQFLTELRIHKLRASAFFSLLKEKREDLLTFSFDCQKNFALPKIPDQTVYYSRQLYLYNFTIVQGSSKDSLTKSNVFTYTWGEHEYPKGSNEIASALFHRLQNTDFTGITVLRCVADGCGGQNKNTTLMFMIQYWMSRYAPKELKKVEVIFPIPGHSFIPPDRVFAQIEKKLKKIETLVQPLEFEEILSQSGTVFKPGRDYADLDWKSASNTFLKPPAQWHFKFAPTKRFFITKERNNKVLIQGEVFYRTEIGVRKSVVKSKRSIVTCKVSAVVPGTVVKPLKLRDVQNLLMKHFGRDWETDDRLIFYKNILASAVPGESREEDDREEGDHEEMCNSFEEDNAARV